MFPAIVGALNECREWIDAVNEKGSRQGDQRPQLFAGLRHRIVDAFQDMGSPRGQAVQAILNDWVAHDEPWGSEARNDAQFKPEDWFCFIQREIQQFTDGPSPRPVHPNAEWEFDNLRLIKIGAIVLTALESRSRLKHTADLAKAAQQILAEGAPI